MFDFLKKLFGKKTESSAQKSGTENTYVHTEKEIQKSVPGPVDRHDSSLTRPGVIREIDRRPAEQRQQPAAHPVEQQQKPAVQPQKPLGQPAWPPVPARPARTTAIVDSGKPVQKPASVIQSQKTEVPAAKPVSPSTRSTAKRRVVSPRTQGRTEVTPAKRIQKHGVYIGLDFGTTFTKAAYDIAPSNVHKKYSIKFGQGDTNADYYLPSVLYFEPNTQRLKISNDTGECEEIRYFKYNMISDALQKNKVLNDPAVVTRTAKEPLCCVFFLSHVISLIRDTVYRNFDFTMDQKNTSWYINMGVPLEAHKNDERAFLYRKVLEIAWLYEQEFHGKTEADIHELDEFFIKHKEIFNPNINILPEIYAEVLLYQQYLNTPAGFYTVVDIGGGTEDIATFLKMTGRFGEKVDCLAQNVIGYGFDSISEKIVKSVSMSSVKKAKTFLSKDIDFNDDENLRTNVPKEVDPDSLLAARLKCRTLFGTCLQQARRKNDEVLQRTVKARLPMHVFVMGGARSVEFYRASIEYMKKVQANAGIPFFKDADVFDYVGSKIQLDIRNDQRLVISQMLAQPFEMIPEITNMPWDLKEKGIKSKAMNWTDLQERQSELYPD